VLIAFGRPKGHRGSYMQWREAGIAPQVVMEVLSPGNRPGELIRKFRFYEQFGVEEYYIYDPDQRTLDVWIRAGEALQPTADTNGFVSPRLGTRFELDDSGLRVVDPEGRLFRTYLELVGDHERERERADRLAERLRALGQDPEA